MMLRRDSNQRLTDSLISSPLRPSVASDQYKFLPRSDGRSDDDLDAASVIAVEMELAILFVMAGMRGLRAGGVLFSDGNLAEDRSEVKMGDFVYDPHRDVTKHGIQKVLRMELDSLSD